MPVGAHRFPPQDSGSARFVAASPSDRRHGSQCDSLNITIYDTGVKPFLGSSLAPAQRSGIALARVFGDWQGMTILPCGSEAWALNSGSRDRSTRSVRRGLMHPFVLQQFGL